MSVQLGVSGVPVIPQGTAYGLLIGLGVAFCGVILVAIKVQRAYLSEDSSTSEMFMVANRSVGRGLTASAVFSSWMWINETVFSAAFCYKFGLAVPFVRPRTQLISLTERLTCDDYSGGLRDCVSRLP